MVQWFCLISWRLFDVCTSYFGGMDQYDLTFDLKINIGHCDLYSMFQWFCLISWRLSDVWTLLFGIMSRYDPKSDLKINIGHCNIFHGPVILRYIFTFWYMNIILWDYGSVWPDVWPQNKCRSMWPIFHVQWFCLTSPRLYDAWVSYFQIMRQCDPNFDFKVSISQHDLYFMV